MKKTMLSVIAIVMAASALNALELNDITTANVSKKAKELSISFPQPVMEKDSWLHPQDAFKGLDACDIVDAWLFKPTLDEVVSALKPCMKAVSQKYGVLVSVSKTLVKPSKIGIGLLISGPLPLGNRILIDITYSLDMRRGALLTYPAIVQYLGIITPY